MQRLFKKILCPVDFDDNAIAALNYARLRRRRSTGWKPVSAILVILPAGFGV